LDTLSDKWDVPGRWIYLGINIYHYYIRSSSEKKRETEEEEKVEVERRTPSAKEAHQNSHPTKTTIFISSHVDIT